MKTIGIRIPRSLHTRLKEAAKELGISMNELIKAAFIMKLLTERRK